jgi:arylsulfatase A-like enzyme
MCYLRSVGRMMAVLQRESVASNTLVVFSADNGGSLHWHDLGGVNGDLRCGKGTTWGMQFVVWGMQYAVCSM